MYRILKPGGKIVIINHLAKTKEDAQKVIHLGWCAMGGIAHLSSLEEILFYMKESGFILNSEREISK